MTPAAAALVALTMTVTGRPTWEQRLDRDAVKIATVETLYGFNYYGKLWYRVKIIHEMGSDVNPMGCDNPRVNNEVQGNPCIPQNAMGYARGIEAMTRAMQLYCLSDPDRRRDFLRFAATFYYSGGGAEGELAQAANNRQYGNDEIKLWPLARKWMNQHGFQDGSYTPLTSSTTFR